MKIVFALIMCLVSAPAFATVYTLDASNAIQSGNLTDGNAHWSGFATTTAFLCPECHVSGNPSPFVDTRLTFDVIPLGQTRVIDGVGRVLIEGITTGYTIVPGIAGRTQAQFTSTFLGRIAPDLTEGVTSNLWTGTLTGGFPTDAVNTLNGLWSLHATTSTTSAVPEPSTFALLVSGVAFWLYRRESR
jgi:hypothetical protein